jgi:hypothetical protein
MTAEQELERLEREIAGGKPKAALNKRGLLLPEGKEAKPRNSFDLVLVCAAVLAIIGVGVNTIRQMPDQQAESLRDGLIGGAAGLLVGYAVGRARP